MRRYSSLCTCRTCETATGHLLFLPMTGSAAEHAVFRATAAADPMRVRAALSEAPSLVYIRVPRARLAGPWLHLRNGRVHVTGTCLCGSCLGPIRSRIGPQCRARSTACSSRIRYVVRRATAGENHQLRIGSKRNTVSSSLHGLAACCSGTLPSQWMWSPLPDARLVAFK